MKIKNIFSLLILGSLLGCNGERANTSSTIQYMDSKSEFNKKLVNHFPPRKITIPYELINSKNIDKNDVSFMLYEYRAGDKTKADLSNSMKKKAVAHYTNNDTDLLIVNRYETINTSENRLDVVISDSSKIEKKSYEKLLPIPNFIDFQEPNTKKDIKLKGNFDIYVLEAKSGNHFKEFDLKPNPQMPKKWKNGYSKGVAIEKERSIIIYWAIVW